MEKEKPALAGISESAIVDEFKKRGYTDSEIEDSLIRLKGYRLIVENSGQEGNC